MTRRTRRTRRSAPAAVVALVLLAAGAAVATSAIQVLLGEPPLLDYPRLAAELHALRWTDWAVAIVGVGLALAGTVLALAAILPGKATVLPLRTGDPGDGIACGAGRRSIRRRTLRAAANAVDVVTSTRLTLRRKTVTATARTHRSNTEGLADGVRAALAHRLDRIAPATRPRIRVKLTTSRSRR